ncbi:hypothetical protein CEXT_703581 [Caerostris extrusa]|uniref:Secreted protein n=1 Tax=Caerostris extrusa TaxID=172846 RepID=A0AAV4N0S4_CAEEX|nr:hypothetical protein CEXT_703581 [Caerostris extrusa]
MNHFAPQINLFVFFFHLSLPSTLPRKQDIPGWNARVVNSTITISRMPRLDMQVLHTQVLWLSTFHGHFNPFAPYTAMVGAYNKEPSWALIYVSTNLLVCGH